MLGNIHSIQTLGALDGPGLRTVVFMQGCPLQCIFCHSVDTTPYSAGKTTTVLDLYNKVISNRPYWGDSNISKKITGGITITGGDPTAQPVFISDFIKKVKEEDIHIAMDTSLFTTKQIIESFIQNIDLWMVSIKHMNDSEHMKLTGRPNSQILENLQYLDNLITEKGLSSKIRIRFVIIPGLTDNQEHLELLGRFVSNIKNLESIELLPYVSIGKYKWIEEFGKYQLENTREANEKDVLRTKEILSAFNIEKIIS